LPHGEQRHVLVVVVLFIVVSRVIAVLLQKGHCCKWRRSGACAFAMRNFISVGRENEDTRISLELPIEQ
jgi:hypothetical protein